MAYVRKTTDQYDILVNYGYNGFERVTTETTLKQAKERKKEYIINDTAALAVIIKKIRVKQ